MACGRVWKTTAVLFCAAKTTAIAQSALEHHAWQDRRTFPPYSRTAEAITGAIKLSGNKRFASAGGTMTVTFGRGKPVKLTSIGTSHRRWSDVSDQKVTAEVFRLENDPGRLKGGNTLCGDLVKEPARYMALNDAVGFDGEPILGVAVFSSKQVPKDINSPGLCGTFNYSIR